MRKNFLLTITSLMLIAYTSSAQCPVGRYNTVVFPANPILTSNVVYGSNIKIGGTTQQLLLDVYEPNGDTLANRPLVIIAHGGSFIGGSKTGSDVVPICKDLAKLGYVTASIEYRLGMTNFPLPGPDSSDATEAVMRGVHDGRAAVRYFRKIAAADSTNIFKIDTNQIYFAGVSAGGFIALQMAYLDQPSEIPSYIDMVGQPGLSGGIAGNSGNAGFSSEVNAIINVCGALGDTAWMKVGDEPVLSFHGTNDNTVPYASATITLFSIYPLLKVDGSYSVSAKAHKLGIPSCFEIYEGQDHVPATTNAAYYDTTITIIKDFLYHFVCSAPLNCINNAQFASIEETITSNIEWSVYPNPANNQIMIDLNNFDLKKTTISIFNYIGQKSIEIPNIKSKQQYIDISSLTPGIYQIVVYTNGKELAKKLVKY